MHAGIVIKTNCNGRYTTDSVSKAMLMEIARDAGLPMQDFIVKQDMACGSTIGPMSAAMTGLKTIDIGAPQLAMHSAREFMGTTDTYYYKELFGAFFRKFGTLNHELWEDKISAHL